MFTITNKLKKKRSETLRSDTFFTFIHLITFYYEVDAL